MICGAPLAFPAGVAVTEAEGAPVTPPAAAVAVAAEPSVTVVRVRVLTSETIMRSQFGSLLDGIEALTCSKEHIYDRGVGFANARISL